MKTAICPKCGKKYNMGINGVKDGCDTCLNLERDSRGYFWEPGEAFHVEIPANAPLDTADWVVRMRPINLTKRG